MPTDPTPPRCSSSKVVHLDVVDGPTGVKSIAKSKNGKKRAIVLIAVQVVLLAHVGLWAMGAFGGSTLSPVEPSEAMQTIETGAINAGFVFFSLALLSTLVFGRFVCGWACHIIMLQDLCAWIMRKCGVRPRPFRSRTLIWVPLILALYMFVWPTFKRLAVIPLMQGLWPSGARGFDPPPPWQGFSNQLITEFYWTNPETTVSFPIIMAVPTLLAVGFAAVYFLGSKGFCTYGCPYGGFFAPIDELAPGRIRVTDACEHCGHCTATCSSNVRVHEEVREYGMVVDPGCMKCMDCVSVCPNDALYFGFGRPATGKGKPRTQRPRKQYDLSVGEDAVVAIVFLLSVLSMRGMYLGEGVPLLMAVALAGVFSFCVFKSWRLLSKKQDIVRLQTRNLKWQGHLRPGGWVMVCLTVLCAGLVIQNGIVNVSSWRAERAMRQLPVNYADAPATIDRPADLTRAADAAIAHFQRSLGVGHGGLALMSEPGRVRSLSTALAVRGDFEQAITFVNWLLQHRGEADAECAAKVRYLWRGGDVDAAIDFGRKTIEQHPTYRAVIDEVVRAMAQEQGVGVAVEFMASIRRTQPDDVGLMRAHGVLMMRDEGSGGSGLKLIEEAYQRAKEELSNVLAYASGLASVSRFAEARTVLMEGLEEHPRSPDLHGTLAAVLRFLGDEAGSARHMELERTYRLQRGS